MEENEAANPITAERIRAILPELREELQSLSLSVRHNLLATLDLFDSGRPLNRLPEITPKDVRRRQANGELRRARFIFTCEPLYDAYNRMINAKCDGKPLVNLDDYPSHCRLGNHELRINTECSNLAASLLERLELPKDTLIEDTKQFDKRGVRVILHRLGTWGTVSTK